MNENQLTGILEFLQTRIDVYNEDIGAYKETGDMPCNGDPGCVLSTISEDLMTIREKVEALTKHPCERLSDSTLASEDDKDIDLYEKGLSGILPLTCVEDCEHCPALTRYKLNVLGEPL